MFVRLSHYQQRSVQHRVPGLHGTAMREHRVVRGRTIHDVELPPIAWRQILDMMREQCFGPAGGRLDRGVPKSAYSAIKKIAEAVMQIENHPALHERAVEGWIGHVVLLWEPGVGGLSPYPAEGAVPVWYWPNHLEIAGREATVWTALTGDPGEVAWSLRPENHLLFSRSRASDGPAPRP